VLTDIEALAELGAAYVVLDTNTDRPQHQPPLDHDWATLTQIAKALAA
jgi:hypothetical protein